MIEPGIRFVESPRRIPCKESGYAIDLLLGHLRHALDPPRVAGPALDGAHACYQQWNAERMQFLKDLPQPGTPAQSQKWQKNYFRGLLPSGQPGAATHETNIQAHPFADRTGSDT